MQFGTSTLTPATPQDFSETDPVPFALVNHPADSGLLPNGQRTDIVEIFDPATLSSASVPVGGPAWGILQPNGKLHRSSATRKADPGGVQPTIWLAEQDAYTDRIVIAATLETLFGMRREMTAELRVVRLELGADGIWKLPAPEPGYHSHRPTDPDTGQPSAWPCTSTDELSVPEAREVMRGHRVCAGPLPCRIRGRARAVLARAGVMQLPSAERAARLWPSLTLPETAR